MRNETEKTNCIRKWAIILLFSDNARINSSERECIFWNQVYELFVNEPHTKVQGMMSLENVRKTCHRWTFHTNSCYTLKKKKKITERNRETETYKWNFKGLTLPHCTHRNCKVKTWIWFWHSNEILEKWSILIYECVVERTNRIK